MSVETLSPPKFLSLRGLATTLGVGVATATRWLQRGMPYLQPGGHRGRILIDPVEAVEWLRRETKKKRQPPNEPLPQGVPTPSRTRLPRRTESRRRSSARR